MMENVREFMNWGPLHSRTKRPIKSRKGDFFRAFIETLGNMGYNVEHKIQVAADFGDPTSRKKGFGVDSVNNPLATVTTRDRFMLVECKTGRTVAELDILVRMLQPHELAAAHSFPKSYKFTGKKGQQIMQIGNSVPVELACAHAEAVLS